MVFPVRVLTKICTENRSVSGRATCHGSCVPRRRAESPSPGERALCTPHMTVWRAPMGILSRAAAHCVANELLWTGRAPKTRWSELVPNPRGRPRPAWDKVGCPTDRSPGKPFPQRKALADRTEPGRQSARARPTEASHCPGDPRARVAPTHTQGRKRSLISAVFGLTRVCLHPQRTGGTLIRTGRARACMFARGSVRAFFENCDELYSPSPLSKEPASF
jgi:hypothetical protein